MRRHDTCPHCGATGQTTGMYCHECGADVTYEDPSADRRERLAVSVRSSVSYLFHTVVAVVLLVCLALTLLYFWGNKAKGSTLVLVGMGAALESEQVTLPLAGDTFTLPSRRPRGPLLLSFRYLLSPPGCAVAIVVRDRAGVAMHRDTVSTSFLTGEGRFRIPVATLPSPAPYTIDIFQDAKAVTTVRLDTAAGGH